MIRDVRTGLAVSAAGSELERQLQLIVPVPLEQVAYRVSDEPGEGNTVLISKRRQLLVVPFVDADRDPCCQLFPTPSSHRGLFPPKHCITVVNGAAMYCDSMIVSTIAFVSIAKFPGMR